MLQRFIDAHVHLNVYAPEILDFAVERGVGLLSINTDVPIFPNLDDQAGVIRQYQHTVPDQVLHITSFSAHNWQADGWSGQAIEQIKREIDRGAVGVKIWKNIGMDAELTYPDGRFLMVDDPKLAPIFEFILKNNLLLITHLGEPRNCWLPLEKMTVDSDREYFREYPQYHMYQHPRFPSYQEQIQARDRMLDRYPELRFVGLHLFSLEWDLQRVDQHLEQYPHTMTDLAERICHVQLQSMQDRESVRRFFIKHQDRIIYGTDFIYDGTQPVSRAITRLETLWKQHWTYFASDQWMQVPQFKGEFRGLDLPAGVLEKIFYANAVKTYGFSLPVRRQTFENFS